MRRVCSQDALVKQHTMLSGEMQGVMSEWLKDLITANRIDQVLLFHF